MSVYAPSSLTELDPRLLSTVAMNKYQVRTESSRTSQV